MQRKAIHRFLSSFLLLISLTSPLLAAESASFQSWSVLCGPDDYCRASTPDQRDQAGPLVVQRANDPSANWEIAVHTRKENPAPFGPESLRIAGQRSNSLLPNQDFATFSKPNEVFLINTAALQLLFRRMIDSRRIFFSFRGENQQKIDASYSLNGLADALLWIDAQQSRVGSRRTVGPPLVRKVAKRNEPPLDPATLAIKQHLKTLDYSDCTIALEENDNAKITVAALDGELSLAIVPCRQDGSNAFSRIFIINTQDKSATLQLWATYFQDQGWSGRNQLSNVVYNAQRQELAMTRHGNAPGECAASGVWKFHNQRFEMQQFSIETLCTGATEDWLQIAPLPSTLQ